MRVSFYVADIKYIRYLQTMDREVPRSRENALGGILGIMVDIEKDKPYFVPLFAASSKLLKKKNVAKDYMLVYETLPATRKARMSAKAVYREYPDGEIQQIYGIFNFKKMFPVDPLLSVTPLRIDEQEAKYRDLLNKELKFVKKHARRILQKARAYYTAAIMSDRVYPQQIDFEKLENELEI